MPKISVIMPVYQVESYIEDCLNSVINQTYKDIEIICIDDCGSDNSIMIVEDFAKQDSRIKIIYHSSNKGLAVARNTGLENAEGEYIFFIDSDDTITLNILEVLHSVVLKGGEDIVMTRTKVYTNTPENIVLQERVRILTEYLSFTPKLSYTVNMDNFTEVLSELASVVWGKLFRRQFLEENNVRFVDQNLIHEDDGFTIKIISNFPKISWIDDIGVFYRIHTESIISNIEASGSELKKMYHIKAVLQDAFNYIKKYHSNANANLFIRKIINHSIYATLYDKEITFLGIHFYKSKFNKRKKERCIKIFGITVCIIK